MKKKTSYCLFCGSVVPRHSAVLGIYVDNACTEPACPHYGTESGSEYEKLEGFSILDYDEVDNADDF